MRRYDVYFLQKKVAGIWETVEKAPSSTVLIGSLIRGFEEREDVAVRVVAADWDEAAADWTFEQIFFVDHDAIDLTLAESPGAGQADTAWAPGARDDLAAESDTPDTADDTTIPGGHDFADAIRAASDDADTESERWSFDDDTDDREDDDTIRELGFASAGRGPAVGPPPTFSADRGRRGRPFFVIGTVLIALILTGAAAIGLMIALDSPHIAPLVEQARKMVAEFRDDMPPPAMSTPPTPDDVIPDTSGQVIRYIGVAPSLRGRWSSGSCTVGYVEFDEDGYVIVAENRPPSVEIPVIETLEDDYTWFLRRSPNLVEHFQKLGSNDIQKIGDTTRSGFLQSTYEIMARCP